MADNIQATPRNYFGGLLSDAYKYMQSPERTQQMQGFAGLLGTTGIPQTIERMAYGEPLTNMSRANVPLLKPETADAMMTVAPMVGPALRGVGAAARGAGRLAGEAVNEAMVYGRGPLASITPQPMNIMLMHGGPTGVVNVDPTKLSQSVQSSGFHMTNKAQTPFSFATKQNKTSGVVSAFDFPDELYAKTLNYDKPISQSQDVMQAIQSLAQNDEQLRQKLVDEMRTLYKSAKMSGQDVKSEDVMTGKQLHSLLRRHYGGLQQADEALQNAGITGSSWQYSAERPNEIATAVFPKYAEQLKPLGQYDATPDSLEEMTRKINADIAMRQQGLLGQ
jgi:hypothetical protein